MHYDTINNGQSDVLLLLLLLLLLLYHVIKITAYIPNLILI